MALVRVDNVGAFGLVRDIAPFDLPPEAWTNALNMRFRDNKVVKFVEPLSVFGAPSITPYSLLAVQTTAQAFWIYAGLTKVYGTDMSTHFNLTRQTAGVDVNYTTLANVLWNGGVLNGVPVLNNSVDEPQMWSPISSGTRLQRISAWNTWPIGGVNTRIGILRPAFRFFLVGLRLNEAGTFDPLTIAWSQPADPGTLPPSWDYTDPSKDAGIEPVADTPGFLQDIVMLGEVGIVYKEDSNYIMQFVGGQSVFRIAKSRLNFGCLATGCAWEIPAQAKMFPGFHFVATQDDVVVHNGQSAISVITDKIKNTLFDTIDIAGRVRSYVRPCFAKQEMWFAYPKVGSAYPTNVLAWNWNTGAIQLRSFSSLIPDMGIGAVQLNAISQAWDADSSTWESDGSVWDARNYDPSNTKLLMATTDPALELAEGDTVSSNGSGLAPNAFLERTGITLIGRDRNGNPKVDQDSIKLITRVLLRAGGSPFTLMLGGQDTKDGPVTWQQTFTVNPADTNEIQCYIASRFPAIRFESLENTKFFELQGYALDISLIGRY